jgi:hypothetical protein
MATTSMQVDTEVCNGTWLFLVPRGVKTEAARPWTLAECSKGRCIRLHAPPTPHIPHPLQHKIQPSYPKWAP